MAEFRISVSLSSLLPAAGALTKDAFPHLAAAVKAITEQAAENWKRYAHGAPLPDGRRINSKSGHYAQSIQLRQIGDFQGEVYSELPYARGIEEGTPARDMHAMLSTSLKVRLTSSGKRYLIIPFRSYGPNSVIGAQMPQAVHDWWKTGKHVDSTITGTYRRLSGTGAYDIKTRAQITVPGWRYRWGTKLSKQDILGMGLGAAAAKRFAGMYRMDKPHTAGKAGGKGGGHQQFINFRTMMEGSPGWRVKAKAGMHIAATVAKQLEPLAQEAFTRGFEADIRKLLRSQG